MKKLTTLFLLFFVSFFLNAQTRYVDETFSEHVLTSNIKYGENIDVNGQNDEVFFDLYQPSGDTDDDRILLIVAHEGGFIGGAKTDAEVIAFCEKMVKKGYVVAAMEYRKGWVPGLTAEENARRIVPALWRAMQDGKAIVRFFRKSVIADGNPYGIDKDKIVGGGFGAGSYIFIHNEYFDLSEEFNIDKVKDTDGSPLIDTVALGSFEGTTGSPGYDWRSQILFNYGGAIGDTLFYTKQKDDIYTPIISCHGTADQTTPFGTDIVFARGTLPVLEVSGSYEIARMQEKFDLPRFKTVTSDGFPIQEIDDPNSRFSPLVIYDKGTFAFVGQDYQPWVNDPTNGGSDNNATAAKYIDSITTYTAHRINDFFFAGVAPTALFSISSSNLEIQFNNLSSGIIASVKWTFGDGESSTETDPLHTYAADGTYEVSLVAFNDFGSDTNTQTIEVFPVGIANNLAKDLNFTLSPNPSTGSFQVTLSIIPEPLNLELLDINGRILSTQVITNSNTFVNTDLSEGVYLVKVYGDSFAITQKLVIR
jgi:hypothetical protein